MNFISYKHIFRYYKKGSVFYDKDLNEYQLSSKFFYYGTRAIIFVDLNEKKTTIHEITWGSRILLSLGISKKIKESIHWDKKLFLTKKYAQKLKQLNEEQILIDYENTLEEGLEKGIITKEEYKNFKKKMKYK